MRKICLLCFLSVLACNESSFRGKSDSGSFSEGSLDAESGFLANGASSVLDKTSLSTGIDLVVALDTSGSMDEEILAVETNLGQLLGSLQKANLDTHVHLIVEKEKDEDAATAPEPFRFPADINPAQVARIAQKVDSHDALTQVTKTLSGLYKSSYRDVKNQPMPTPLAFRDGAKLEVLVISDDNAEKVGAFDPKNQWNATVSGIIGLPNSAQADGLCGIAAVGQEYINLASKSGGTVLDICSKDWTAMIQRFSKDLVKRSASVHLSKTPESVESLVVYLDETRLPAGAWSYDAAQNRVILAASTVYAAGMVLRVNYLGK